MDGHLKSSTKILTSPKELIYIGSEVEMVDGSEDEMVDGCEDEMVGGSDMM